MKPEPPETEKKLGKDLETFAALPAKTQELETLQDQAQKSIGPEKAAVDKEIRRKAAQPTSPER